jgi:hypothetical protein
LVVAFLSDEDEVLFLSDEELDELPFEDELEEVLASEEELDLSALSDFSDDEPFVDEADLPLLERLSVL